MKGRKNIVWISPPPRLRLVMESRNLDPDNLTLVETSLTFLLVPFTPLGRIKRSFVLCYKPLPSLCTADKLTTLQGGSCGWRMGVSTMQWPCWVCRAWAAPVQLVLGSPLPNLFPLTEPGSQVQTWLWVSLNPKLHHCRGWKSLHPLQLSIMEGMFARRLCCPSPGSHSCKFDSRNWLLLGGSMTLCKHIWAPGLPLVLQRFFRSGIASARPEVCPRLWGFYCLT